MAVLRRGGAPSLNSTHLGQIKDTAGGSHWALFKERNIDTSIVRLRINHSRLNFAMNRLKLSQSPYCGHCPNCVEDSTHIMLNCNNYYVDRLSLLNKVVQITSLACQDTTLKILIDGAGFTPPVRRKILKETAKFKKISGINKKL